MALSRSKERERAIMTESTSGTSEECRPGRKDKKTDYLLLSVFSHGLMENDHWMLILVNPDQPSSTHGHYT